MLPALSQPDARMLTRTRDGKTFDQVRSEVEARASLAFQDQTLAPSDLRVTDDGLVEVPRVGLLALTEWSRSQLARMLGIARWERWFAHALVSGRERAQELNRRLSRLASWFIVRARRYAPGETADASTGGLRGDGIMRALLSATYTPIDDTVLFEKLALVLGGRQDEMRFTRVCLTDRSSHYAATSAEVLDMGLAGVQDLLHPGVILRNSEVGFTALTMDVFLWRLVCTNGLTVVEDRHLLRRVHRGNWDLKLGGEIVAAFAKLPQQWERAKETLRFLRSARLDDPQTELRRLVQGNDVLRHHIEAIEAAYTEEPEPTRYGIVQAITRAARTLNADTRFEIERSAGRLLSRGFASVEGGAS